MTKQILKVISGLIICTFFCCLSVKSQEALDITEKVTFNCIGISKDKITDRVLKTHSAGENVTIEIESTQPIGFIYIKFNSISSKGFLNESTPVSQNGFLHEYIAISGEKKLKLFYQYTDICDIYVYSQGDIPKDIQLWKNGKAETDLLLCATHSDDDQLFFAGLLPYYAMQIGANVRVSYFVNHFDTYNRTHELLDGLWHCGITNYPDISPFPDGYSESVDGAMSYFLNKGITYNDVLEYQKNLINKYKPLAVVLHDFNGEYGHGAHMLNTKSFIEAFENIKNNGGYVPEKIYVHLYNENKITLNIDQPLSVFDEKTAFQVSQEAFQFHTSQHWTWFYNWIYGKNNNISVSSQIKKYSPCEYGLYYTNVGQDVAKNDILENIVTYSQREEIAIKKKLEEERIEREKIQAQILLQQQKQAEEQKRLEQEKIEKQAKKSKKFYSTISVCSFTLILILLISIFINNRKKR